MHFLLPPYVYHVYMEYFDIKAFPCTGPCRVGACYSCCCRYPHRLLALMVPAQRPVRNQEVLPCLLLFRYTYSSVIMRSTDTLINKLMVYAINNGILTRSLFRPAEALILLMQVNAVSLIFLSYHLCEIIVLQSRNKLTDLKSRWLGSQTIWSTWLFSRLSEIVSLNLFYIDPFGDWAGHSIHKFNDGNVGIFRVHLGRRLIHMFYALFSLNSRKHTVQKLPAANSTQPMSVFRITSITGEGSGLTNGTKASI